MVDIMLKFKTDIKFEGRRLMILEDAYYMQSCVCSERYNHYNGVYCAKAIAEDGEHVVLYFKISNAEEVQLEDEMCDWANPVCVFRDDDFDFNPDEYEEIEFD